VGYELDSKGTSLATRQSLGDWSGVNLVRSADLNRDGFQDYVYRTTAGAVYWDHFQLNSARDDGSWVSTKIFANWKTRTRIIAPGDVTGDYLPDLVSVDSAGVLWIYPGKGNGTFAIRSASNAFYLCPRAPARPRARSSAHRSRSAPVSGSTTASAEIAGERGIIRRRDYAECPLLYAMGTLRCATLSRVSLSDLAERPWSED
jgi:hypothetical protein